MIVFCDRHKEESIENFLTRNFTNGVLQQMLLGKLNQRKGDEWGVGCASEGHEISITKPERRNQCGDLDN